MSAPLGAPAPQALARSLIATRTQFAVLGILGGLWGAHIPSVKSHYALDEAMLSVVLLAAACGALLSLFTAGRVVGRLGARHTCVVAAMLMCATFSLVLLPATLWLLLPLVLVFGMGMSLFDVAINAEGTALESLSGRKAMGGLHGMFSIGGMSGAGLAAALIALGVPAAAQFAGVAAALFAVALYAAARMLDIHPSAEAEAHFAWPRGTLLVIGLLIFAGMTAEGVMYDWSVLYLKQEVGLPQAHAAIGYAVFSAAMAAARFGGDAARERFSERRLLAGGAALAAVAMAAVLLARQPVVAFAGYALVGIGLALVVPILYNAATKVPGTSRAAAIASVSSIGYAGFMVGPPLIGGIAQASSLSWAMGVIVLAAGVLAAASRRVM